MSKSTTQKQKDSESDGNRQDIRQTGEAYTSNIIRKIKLSNAAMNTISQSSILVTGNAVLKWQRNFEDLKLAVDRLQIRASNWSSPGGYCKLFENGEISIRWCSNSKILTVKGEKVDEVKEKLLNFVRKLNAEAFVYQLLIRSLLQIYPTEICILSHSALV